MAVARAVRPPVDAGFIPLTGERAATEHPFGLRLSVNPTDLAPDFGVKLTAIAPDQFLDSPGEEWQAARAALPAALRLQSVVFGIETSGELPRKVSVDLTLVADPAMGNHLDLYGWSGERWEFVPARHSGRELHAELEYFPRSLAAFETEAQIPFTASTLETDQEVNGASLQALNLLFPAGLRVKADGSLRGDLAGGFSAGQGYAVMPVVRNYGPDGVDGAALEGILRDESARAGHIRQLVDYVLGGDYDGLAIDYRGLATDHTAAFNSLVIEAAGELHSQDKRLAVVVETPTRVGSQWSTGGYNWRALGAAADFLEVSPGEAPVVYGDGTADSLIAWAVGEVSRHKILLSTTALSVDRVGATYSAAGYEEILSHFGRVTRVSPGGSARSDRLRPGQSVRLSLSGSVLRADYDDQARAARLQYRTSEDQSHTAWLIGASAVRRRFELAERYHLGGGALRDLFDARATGGAADALVEFSTHVRATEGAHPPQVAWTVAGTDGQVIRETVAEAGKPFDFLAETAGKFLIGARYLGEDEVDLGAVSVEVAALTPTPSPTAEVRGERGVNAPGASPSPTPPAGGAPAPTALPPPAAPPPLAPITGNFELGGQVLGGIPAGVMQSAHMRWVKTQARGGDMSGFIAEAHGQGLKVQLTVLLDIARAADPSYWPEVAAYAAAQAAAGADAIEVWNEMNIDAEWPAGLINPTSYVEMLKQVYPAIKAANPGTLVISGALAPTGAEAAFPGRVMNDDNFIRGMAAAGAGSYMDCVGIHYNTGTTSPSATTGSALGGYHYSYYFWPMVDLYWGAFGGARQLCFTELGYLSGEGYGTLPANFAWAGGVTVAHQAAWLAEAASLGGNSGKVRMMIVWNVNSTTWTHDPQAGYAIIRQDGGCPACSALASVAP